MKSAEQGHSRREELVANRLIMIRHAQSRCNEAFSKGIEGGRTNPTFRDATLSQHGIQQCIDARPNLDGFKCSKVLVSPLRRCLLTAAELLKARPDFD